MRQILTRFIKFAGVGGVATFFQYALLVLSVETLGIPPLIASVCAYLLSALFNYWANYHYTFAVAISHRRTLPRFGLVSGCGLVINALVFYAVFAGTGAGYLVAQVVATAVVLLWNFLANNFWSFSDSTDSGRTAE